MPATISAVGPGTDSCGGFGEQVGIPLEQSALGWARQGAGIRDLIEHTELARAAFELAQSSDDELGPPVEVEDVIVPVPRSGAVGLRLFRAGQSRAPLPVVLYCHGPGWALGDCATHDRLMRELAVRSGAVTAFVDYSRAPEARYPAALNECHAVAVWVAEHGQRYGLDPRRIAVAGDSAGANLAIAMTRLAKEDHGSGYRGQLLLCPWCDSSLQWSSYKELGDLYPWGASAVRSFWDSYLPEGDDGLAHAISPARAPTGELAGLPPALVITAEADVARDEGEAYAAKLRLAGVPTTALRYQGALADFVVIDALRDTCAARSAIACAGAFLREQLEEPAD